MLSTPNPSGLELNIPLTSLKFPINHVSSDESVQKSNSTHHSNADVLTAQSSQSPATYTLSWVRHQDQLHEIQAFRARVTRHHANLHLLDSSQHNSKQSPELGLFNSNVLVKDIFDSYCEHILVKNSLNGEVLASCRLLTPAQSKRVGGLELENDFDLTRIRAWRSKVLELGRVCVHPLLKITAQQRIIHLLKEQIAGFAQSNQLLMVIGVFHEFSAHDKIQDLSNLPDRPALLGNTRAAWQLIRRHHLSPIEFQLRARYPLIALKEDLGSSENLMPLQSSADRPQVQKPVLLAPEMGTYLKMGAKVMGQPSWSREQGAVHWALMLRSNDLSPVLSNSARN